MDFIPLLSLLDKFPLEWITLIAVVYLVVKIKSMDDKIQSVDDKLGNHITDTNNKIERLSDRFEHQSDRFDRLYEILLKEKGQK